MAADKGSPQPKLPTVPPYDISPQARAEYRKAVRDRRAAEQRRKA